MINVLMINKLFHPAIGGIEITLTQLCEKVAEDPNFTVSVLTSNEKRFAKTTTYRWKNANINKIYSLGILFSTPIALQFPLALKKLIQENDVFHFHIPNPVGELSFLLNKMPTHKKVIVTVHADVSQTQKKFFALFYNFMLKKLLDRADVVTVSAPQNMDSFPILKNYQHKCVVISSAFDESNIKKVNIVAKEIFKEKFGLSTSKKNILFVGRLSYYKGISFLIDSMQSVKNAQLVIVGDGNLKPALVKKVKQLQLNESVFFVGKLSSEMLATAYSIADIFVLPSIKKAETFGLVQAEAMAYGLPVINTELNTGVNFVSVHNITGLTVQPSDSLALQQAIQTILTDDKLRGVFSKNALKKATLFSPEKMVDAFKKLYIQSS